MSKMCVQEVQSDETLTDRQTDGRLKQKEKMQKRSVATVQSVGLCVGSAVWGLAAALLITARQSQ